MRLGLTRIKRLLRELGNPQQQFPAIHIVGSNGKTSTARMSAALLEAEGFRTGVFTSPHLRSFCERIRIGECDIDQTQFDRAMEVVEVAVNRIETTDDPVTQFELLTATALYLFAETQVDVAVIEAGLGGRHDATNVLSAPVVVLTDISLEHQHILGDTVTAIANEKLAVLGPGAALVIGARDPEVRELAVRHGQSLGSPVVCVDVSPNLPGYQHWNFRVACCAVEAWQRKPIDPTVIETVAKQVVVPGRLQQIAEKPLTVIDAAHNPAAIDALVAALPALIGDRPLVSVFGVLDDKDVDTMLVSLAPRCEYLFLTAPKSERALPAQVLQTRCQALGFSHCEVELSPAVALSRARARVGENGAAIATGSIYLIGELLEQ